MVDYEGWPLSIGREKLENPSGRTKHLVAHASTFTPTRNLSPHSLRKMFQDAYCKQKARRLQILSDSVGKYVLVALTTSLANR